MPRLRRRALSIDDDDVFPELVIDRGEPDWDYDVSVMAGECQSRNALSPPLLHYHQCSSSRNSSASVQYDENVSESHRSLRDRASLLWCASPSSSCTTRDQGDDAPFDEVDHLPTLTAPRPSYKPVYDMSNIKDEEALQKKVSQLESPPRRGASSGGDRWPSKEERDAQRREERRRRRKLERALADPLAAGLPRRRPRSIPNLNDRAIRSRAVLDDDDSAVAMMEHGCIGAPAFLRQQPAPRKPGSGLGTPPHQDDNEKNNRNNNNKNENESGNNGNHNINKKKKSASHSTAKSPTSTCEMMLRLHQTGSDAELLELHRELEALRAWSTRTEGGPPKEARRVRFAHPPVTAVKFRPFTKRQDVANLFFDERELAQLEWDRRTRIPDEIFECFATDSGERGMKVSVTFPKRKVSRQVVELEEEQASVEDGASFSSPITLFMI